MLGGKLAGPHARNRRKKKKEQHKDLNEFVMELTKSSFRTSLKLVGIPDVFLNKGGGVRNSKEERRERDRRKTLWLRIRDTGIDPPPHSVSIFSPGAGAALGAASSVLAGSAAGGGGVGLGLFKTGFMLFSNA